MRKRTVAAIGVVALTGAAAAATLPGAIAREAGSRTGVQVAACNPCAARRPAANPCGANPCAAAKPKVDPNPRASGKPSPCAATKPANPCAAQNPCAANRNPCGAAVK